jgi:hypothetical protein
MKLFHLFRGETLVEDIMPELVGSCSSSKKRVAIKQEAREEDGHFEDSNKTTRRRVIYDADSSLKTSNAHSAVVPQKMASPLTRLLVDGLLDQDQSEKIVDVLIGAKLFAPANASVRIELQHTNICMNLVAAMQKHIGSANILAIGSANILAKQVQLMVHLTSDHDQSSHFFKVNLHCAGAEVAIGRSFSLFPYHEALVRYGLWTLLYLRENPKSVKSFVDALARGIEWLVPTIKMHVSDLEVSQFASSYLWNIANQYPSRLERMTAGAIDYMLAIMEKHNDAHLQKHACRFLTLLATNSIAARDLIRGKMGVVIIGKTQHYFRNRDSKVVIASTDLLKLIVS